MEARLVRDRPDDRSLSRSSRSLDQHGEVEVVVARAFPQGSLDILEKTCSGRRVSEQVQRCADRRRVGCGRKRSVCEARRRLKGSNSRIPRKPATSGARLRSKPVCSNLVA